MLSLTTTRLRSLILNQGCILLVLFSCLISGITAATDSDIQPTTVTVKIPDFVLRLLVHQDLINPFLFRSHVHHITNNHLTDYWMDLLEVSFNAESFQGLTLQSTLREGGDESEKDPRLQIDITFSGYLTVSIKGNQKFPNEPFIRSRFENGLTGDKYWNLVQHFVEDPVLENIDTVDVIFTEPIHSQTNKANGNTANNKQGSIAVLVIFSSIFLFATLALIYLSHRRVHTKFKSCCSQHSRASVDTESAGDDVEDDDDLTEDYHSQEGKPNKARSATATTTRRIKRRKRRGTIIDTRSSPQVPSLDSIREEDEDGMTVMPTEEDDDDDDDDEDYEYDEDLDDVTHELSQISTPGKISV